MTFARRLVPALALLVAAAAPSAAPGRAPALAPVSDPLVAAIRAGAAAVGQPPAFERTVVATRGDDRQTRVERFDPRAAAGARWTLVSIDGAPPPESERQQFVKQMRDTRPPGYWRMSLLLANGATRAAAPGEPVLRVAPLPADALDGQARDFADKLAAELRVTPGERPVVRETRVYAPQPLRRGPARVDALEAVSRYALGPGGVPLLSSQTTQTRVSVLGRAMVIETRSTYRYI
jgi:hypothetical protein